MKNLQDMVVVVTGAGSGIGRALAVEIARRGGVLALSDVDSAGLQQTADLVAEATGQPVRLDKLDVRERDAWTEYAASVAAEFGRVNVLVNNAGIALTADVAVVGYEEFEQVMDVDFWGVVYGTKAFLPYLIASGDGHLVNMSSLFGLMAVPGQSAYSAAKFAVRGFTESLRQEMLLAGHPVRVTCVHPGGVKTAIARNALAVGVNQRRNAVFFDRHLARTSAEKAAEIILAGMIDGKPRVLVGTDALLLDAVVRLVGPHYQRIVSRVLGRRR